MNRGDELAIGPTGLRLLGRPELVDENEIELSVAGREAEVVAVAGEPEECHNEAKRGRGDGSSRQHKSAQERRHWGILDVDGVPRAMVIPHSGHLSGVARRS